MGFSVITFDEIFNSYDVVQTDLETLNEALEYINLYDSQGFTFSCRDELVLYAQYAAKKEFNDGLLLRTKYFDISCLSDNDRKRLLKDLKTSGKEYILNESKIQDLLTIKCSVCQSEKNYKVISGLDYNFFICQDCYRKKFPICDGCGQKFLSDKIIETKYKKYCLECFLDYFYCDNCKKIMKQGEEHYYKNEGIYVCKNCLKENGRECISCDGVFLKSDMRQSAEGYLCSNCCNDDICDCCHAPLEEENFYSDHEWGGYICENCFHERYSECPSCGKYAPSDDFVENDKFKGDSVCRECDEKL